MLSAIWIIAALGLTGCGDRDRESPPPGQTSAQDDLPPGKDVNGWWVHGGEISDQSMLTDWSLVVTNVTNDPKSTYVALSMFGPGGDLLTDAQCMTTNAGVGEFADPGEEVLLDCGEADGDPTYKPLPEYESFTMATQAGFPTTPEERDEMGH